MRRILKDKTPWIIPEVDNNTEQTHKNVKLEEPASDLNGKRQDHLLVP